jgi:hypothetical protein
MKEVSRARRTPMSTVPSVGDSPGRPLKQRGKPHLKPAKSQDQTRPA